MVAVTGMVLQSSFVTASTDASKKQCNVDLETATKVNTWTNNNVIFRSDQEVWNTGDYWQTPRETIYLLHGDCEDYAIFKYFTLINWGIPPEDLQLWYGYHYQIPHMVVNYCGTVLDSNTNEILPIAQSTFTPRFRVDNTDIKLWQNLTQRIK